MRARRAADGRNAAPAAGAHPFFGRSRASLIEPVAQRHRPGRRLRGDPVFWLALAAGPVFCLLLDAALVAGSGGAPLQWPPRLWPPRLWPPDLWPPDLWPPALWRASPGRFALAVVVYPVLEEMVFRGGLQPWLDTKLGRWRRSLCGSPVTAANGLTSVAFALAHLYAHAPAWALATAAPSLVFGYFRDRSGGLAAPIALHICYNASYFVLAA